MHVFQVAFYGAGAFYALFMERSVLLPFFIIVVLYMLAPYFITGVKSLSTRKKIMVGTWGDPSQPSINVRVPVRTEKVEQVIEKYSNQVRLTITHFCVKALGQILVHQPNLNGLLTLGHFVQRESIDVNVLVNIQDGKDLALLLVKNVDKMSVEDIARFINEKARTMKREGGGKIHKKQIQGVDYVPAFLHQFLGTFFSYFIFKLQTKMSINEINLGVLGSTCVTSLGGMGFEDVMPPFVPILDWSFGVGVNKILKQPVVEGDKVVIGNVMNCNFMVDHRYVDGANCAKLPSVFRDVFQNPEKYMGKCLKSNDSKNQ